MHLRFTLANDGVVINPSDMTGPDGSGAPQFRMRLRNEENALAHSFDVIDYSSPSDDFNAEVVFTFDALTTPGVYVCEVDAAIDGERVTFPSDGNRQIRFTRDVGL